VIPQYSFDSNKTFGIYSVHFLSLAIGFHNLTIDISQLNLEGSLVLNESGLSLDEIGLSLKEVPHGLFKPTIPFVFRARHLISPETDSLNLIAAALPSRGNSLGDLLSGKSILIGRKVGKR
jgi:hypothetical protein